MKKSSVSNDKTLTNNPSLRKIQVNANLPYTYSKEHTPNSYSNVHKREETNTLGSTSRSPINFDHQKYNDIRNSQVNLTNSEHSLTNLNVGYKDTSQEYLPNDNFGKTSNTTRRQINFDNQQSTSTVKQGDSPGQILNANVTTIKKQKYAPRLLRFET